MRAIKKGLFFIICLTILIIISAPVSANNLKRNPKLNIRGLTGDDFISQIGVLYPIYDTRNSSWYTDIRYRLSEEDIDEWNIGFGYRNKKGDTDGHIRGVYIFRDRRKEYDYYWDMWTVGGEILTEKIDLRVNAYIADNNKVLAPGASAGGSPTVRVNESQQLVISTGNEIYYKAMDGLDFEIGKRFYNLDNIFKDVGIYAKYYTFFESDVDTIRGKEIRVDKQFGDKNKTTWKLGLKWQDDNVRGSNTEATFAISIPFGKGSSDLATAKNDVSEKDILETRMTEQPERDLDIVVGEAVSNEASKNKEAEVEAYDSEGNKLGKIWYVTSEDNDNTEGTESEPVDIDYLVINNILTVNEGVSIKGGPILEVPSEESNDIIVFMGGNNDFNLDTQKLSLKYGQKLLSTGYGELAVRSQDGSINTFFKPDGKRAKITGRETLIEVSGNNTLSGLELAGTDSDFKLIDGNSIAGQIKINNMKLGDIDGAESSFQSEIASLIELGVGKDPGQEFNIEIKNNDFEIKNSSIFEEIKGIYIDNHDSIDANESITISNNNFVNLNSEGAESDYAVNIWYLNTNNAPVIKANNIDNTDIGIYFNEIVGLTEEDRLNRLENFNTEYEKQNDIKNYEIVDVSDHIIKDWHDLNAVREDMSSIYLMKANLNSDSEGYEELAGAAANGGKGWKPIGGPYFQGIFAGNNMTISDLVINRPEENYVALFADNFGDAVIRDLGLENANIRGHTYVGGIAGLNEGNIENSYTTGQIKAKGRNEINYTMTGVTEHYYLGEKAGGIVGENTGSITNSYSTADIDGDSNIGGLAGENSGDIIDSYSEGLVKGNILDQEEILAYISVTEDDFINIGGLAGLNEGTIENSFSTGEINGQKYVGGISGDNKGNITNSYSESNIESGGDYIGGLSGNNSSGSIYNSYAAGNIKGNESVGGLVGYSYMGSINNSYAEGKVEGSSGVGGLVGYNNTTSINDSYALGNIYSQYNGAGGLVGYNNNGNINKSYAEGDVNSGGYNSGGLVGNSNGGSISNSYAKGNVKGYDSVGGLVGYNINSGSIEKSYAAGYISADNINHIGGLVGYNSGGTVDTTSYWDIDTSGQISSDGGNGLTTDEMKDLSNYDGWDFVNTWD
ncbi:MAG: GLUG motif-containing protein, partial [Bacillota bacterium]